MRNILKDIRLGFRALGRTPGFTFVSILTLALGIGASTSIFSVVNSVLLRQLPFPNAHELVGVWNTAPGFGFDILQQSETTYTIFQDFNSSFVDIGLFGDRTLNLVGDGEPVRVQAASATASMFRVLGVPPAKGRVFDEDDDEFGSSNVVIISEELWRGRFGSDPDILGRMLNLDDTTWKVIGVMPPAFTFPGESTQLWIPHRIDLATLGRTDFRYDAIGRLKPGVSLEAAKADLDQIVNRLPELSPGELTAEALENAQFATIIIETLTPPLRTGMLLLVR
jgi:putative ABC transport system permease protein